MKEEPRTPVQIPDREATELVRKLRNALPGVGVSVYAFVSPKGVRALEVVADNPDDEAEPLRCEIKYGADKDLDKVTRHAVSRIKNEFAL